MIWIIARITALIGLADATYLTAEHYLGVTPACHIVTGCERVLTSSYAQIGPIPLSALGMLYYGAVIAALLHPHEHIRGRILILLATLGLLSTLYFMYLQAVVLSAFCLYCLISALTSVILYGLALTTSKQKAQSKKQI